ncbi:MAG: serine-type D-Ala-D-Ala carboxypeptidase, partial [Gammaproteobacteria bacterium]|nr:serine-type D-Ala-D-Ala carboxypeptidase [Gammaproteobacteria bacterium]
LPLGLADDLWVTIPRGTYSKLKASMNLNSQIVAPVQKGKVYGSVNLDLEGKPYLSRDLVALKSIAEGGFVSGIIDEVKMMLE